MKARRSEGIPADGEDADREDADREDGSPMALGSPPSAATPIIGIPRPADRKKGDPFGPPFMNVVELSQRAAIGPASASGVTTGVGAERSYGVISMIFGRAFGAKLLGEIGEVGVNARVASISNFARSS